MSLRQVSLGPADGPSPSPIETDALIIGAGPVGLYQVFQLGLLEIAAQVVDSLPSPGGQPVELYPDKPIYDLPAIPVCTGQELADSLLRQVQPFQPGMHLGQTVTGLARLDDGRLLASTSKGLQFLARTVFIAAGVGAFEPKRLAIAALTDFEQRQVFFRTAEMDLNPPGTTVVVGGSEDALAAVLELTDAGHDVVLVHRKDTFDATEGPLERLQTLRQQGRVKVVIGQPTGVDIRDGRLTAVEVSAADNSVSRVALDRLLVRLGISPRLGPLADWGLALERKHLPVDTAGFRTSEPGIHAVGDINTYPGKRKFIICGFHECVLAAYAAAAYLRPDQKILMQYTTTSPRLHELLGVNGSRP
ncbi:MAG: NAD(P)/FAD-dependent oxidoreductase [Gammaproteobacteria bacterium]